MKRQNWGQLVHLASAQSSIAPVDFWKMSLWEWRQLTHVPVEAHASRQHLEQLISQFPDEILKE